MSVGFGPTGGDLGPWNPRVFPRSGGPPSPGPYLAPAPSRRSRPDPVIGLKNPANLLVLAPCAGFLFRCYSDPLPCYRKPFQEDLGGTTGMKHEAKASASIPADADAGRFADPLGQSIEPRVSRPATALRRASRDTR